MQAKAKRKEKSIFDSDSDDDDKLNDLSGNPNDLMLMGDYLIEFDTDTREPNKPDSTPRVKLTDEEDKKPY